MSDTPRTNAARIESLGKHWWKSFAIMAEHAEQLERENTALRSHAERLAEALEELIKVLRKEAPGTPLNHHRYDQLGIDCNNAITAYRAENPKK